MKHLIITILLMIYSAAAIPKQLKIEWWWPSVLGAPCTTKTDRIEGTCDPKIKRKPEWK